MASNRDSLDEFEEDYIGNMWGWKFSYLSLALILIFCALIAYQYFQTGEFPRPEGFESPEKVQVDSTNTDNQ